MQTISKKLRKKIISIVEEEYDGCKFYTAASQLLVNKINDISQSLDKDPVDFTAFRDSIGEIGIFINNAEKRLLEVEECYTKIVEALSDTSSDEQADD